MRNLRAREKAAGLERKQAIVFGRELESAKRLARDLAVDEQSLLGAALMVATAMVDEQGEHPEFRRRLDRALDALAVARGKKSTNQTELELTPHAA